MFTLCCLILLCPCIESKKYLSVLTNSPITSDKMKGLSSSIVEWVFAPEQPSPVSLFSRQRISGHNSSLQNHQEFLCLTYSHFERNWLKSLSQK